MILSLECSGSMVVAIFSYVLICGLPQNKLMLDFFIVFGSQESNKKVLLKKAYTSPSCFFFPFAYSMDLIKSGCCEVLIGVKVV